MKSRILKMNDLQRTTWTAAVALFTALLLVFFCIFRVSNATALVIVVSAAILVTFTAVNLVLVSLIPRFERSYERLRDTWPAVLIAFAVTMLEIGGADWLRLVLLSFVARF